jgi:aminopeptidase N
MEMSRTRTAPVVKLAEYAPPPYQALHVDMRVRLHPTATEVDVTTTYRAIHASDTPPPLVLDGDELTLGGALLDGEPLASDAYAATPDHFMLKAPPKREFSLTIRTVINPTANTKLMGLYRSNGIYCTQCEADGFRRISYFLDRPDVMATYRVRLEADAAECPVLLANGNPDETGQLHDGRHFAVWNDPHPKPCYLFAMVGGDLGSIHSRYTTADGRDVALGVYVEKGKEGQADYAMEALKASMRWDEKVFGLNYDLDVFNIVAVSDFNMGAMENKGLNIFNDKYVLASPDTATDTDYMLIEAIIAHEYFHNWTGNRITCRDWFQLCLKEGLTVFRDQEFTSDMRSRAVKRILDAKELKSRQFVEDAGPLAHPVRPSAYNEINNLYTATVYEKGAEVIRMLKRLIGDKAFSEGMQLYFRRHDGEAATIEQFIDCFAEAAETDLAAFSLWYNQAGTPRVSVTRSYDAARREMTLSLKQETPPTPGEASKRPQVIPVVYGLAHPDKPASQDQLHVLRAETDSIVIPDVDAGAVPSLFRGFSAPVNLDIDLTDDELLTLAARDSDSFNRWQALQMLAMRRLRLMTSALRDGRSAEPGTAVCTAIEAALEKAELDPAFAALAIAIPGESDIAREIGSNVDPDAIFLARRTLRRSVGNALATKALAARRAMPRATTYNPDARAAGRRSFRNAALDLAVAGGADDAIEAARRQFASADNMTDQFAALSMLAHADLNRREEVIGLFERQHIARPLVMDKWFALQACLPEVGVLDRIRRLLTHPAFSLTNPNRARSLIGGFAMSNPTQFHRADGKGYRFVAEMALQLDATNPQVAARIMTAFRTWRTLEPGRRARAQEALNLLADHDKLSRDVRDIVDRSLA